MFPEAGQFGQMTPVNSIDSTASGVSEHVGIHAEQVQNQNANNINFYRQQKARRAVENFKRNLSKMIEQQVKDRFELISAQNNTNISGRQRPKLVRQERLEEDSPQNQTPAAWNPPAVRQERLTSTGITRDNSMELQDEGTSKQQNSDVSQFYMTQ